MRDPLGQNKAVSSVVPLIYTSLPLLPPLLDWVPSSDSLFSVSWFFSLPSTPSAVMSDSTFGDSRPLILFAPVSTILGRLLTSTCGICALSALAVCAIFSQRTCHIQSLTLTELFDQWFCYSTITHSMLESAHPCFHFATVSSIFGCLPANMSRPRTPFYLDACTGFS